jgi:hypothetical protein
MAQLTVATAAPFSAHLASSVVDKFGYMLRPTATLQSTYAIRINSRTFAVPKLKKSALIRLNPC